MLPTNTKEDGIINLKNSANEMASDLHNAAHQAGQKVRSLYNTASNDITHISHKVTGEIRSNPIRSSMIALGLGVVLGALIRR